MLLQTVVHRNVHFGRNSIVLLDKQMGNYISKIVVNCIFTFLGMSRMTGVNIQNVVGSTRHAL